MFMPMKEPVIMSVKIKLRIIPMPPIVGVPDFDLCQLGPISLISCPNLNLRKTGIKIAVSIKLMINAVNIKARQSTTAKACFRKGCLRKTLNNSLSREKPLASNLFSICI
jgi:hypothetical protein